MATRSRTAQLMVLAATAIAAHAADAQSLGSFTWQLQPFCNKVTVSVTQNGGVYTLDGYDDQCGSGPRAPLVGLATPNPDGTIGLGFHIATVPGGKTVSVEARITPGPYNGPWTDSAGNSGTLAFGGNAGGSPRPAPGAGPVAVNSVTSTSIADGAVSAADVDASQVQLRLTGVCPTGQFMSGASSAGAVGCSAGSSGGTALGASALADNTTGGANTAIGVRTLRHNLSGGANVAVGEEAQLENRTGYRNVAVGFAALKTNTASEDNVAIGIGALHDSFNRRNTAVGAFALFGTTGENNTALGFDAGRNVSIGLNNIHIGNRGMAGDVSTIKIGTSGTHSFAFLAGVRGVTTNTAAVPVLVGTDGQLGTTSSSRRFKQDITDMNDFSARVAKLRPVTFRYTQPVADGTKPLDFGLVAEEVAEVFPELAVTGADGQIETVAYHKLPALLLNELQKLQRVVEAQARELSELRATLDIRRQQ